ncbi:CG0192-related protein [Arthrobacter sp. CJ23]|uniref:CG0192-related protein n=1 Tax=Arthrobacter sp. CJ23 TaxID=2972479 RepID=UPI00215D4328|nr:hypothetical protein [Arthrobacter sp. CJ23]UVJ39171.1 hypothetical protein NVV90_18500 [Arthrobacter sp. CJ23]
MAILHKATLTPSKLELIAQHLPLQPWFVQDDSAQPELVGAYRFDDPDGEVGLETHLVSHGGRIYQLPLSYRDAALPGAEAWLVGTTDHSVLGKRWVYDACADPVYAAALATAILTGQEQAEQFVQADGKLEPRPSTVSVKGSGTPDVGVPALAPEAPVTENGVTTIDAGELTLLVNRVLGLGRQPSEGPALRGIWAGQETPVELASLRR